MTNPCRDCQTPTDATICRPCMTDVRTALDTIRTHLPAARNIARNQASHTTNGTTGKPGSRPPINLHATTALDAIAITLSTWARIVARQHGATYAVIDDAILEAAGWLHDHHEQLRQHPDAHDYATAIHNAAHAITRIADGPPPQRYLGPCGQRDDIETTGPADQWRIYTSGRRCPGDVYATIGHTTGRCDTCRTRYHVADRQAWLDTVVRDFNYRAAHIADAYGLNANTIRKWHERGRLHAKGVDPQGRPLFNVGDVLDLANRHDARHQGRA